MFDYQYRLWLLKSLFKVFAPPLAITLAVVRLVSRDWDGRMNGLFTAVVFVISVPVFWIVSGWLAQLDDERKARRMGLKQAPLMEGKSWGNMDLANRLGNGIMHDYPGQTANTLLNEARVNTARMTLFGDRMLVTRDPEVVRFVLSTGFSTFRRDQDTSMALHSFFGKGLVTMDNKPARDIRANARPFLARSRIGDLHTVSKNCDKVILIFTEKADRNEPCDVQDVFERFTMDTGVEFFCGDTELNTLGRPLRRPRYEATLSNSSSDYSGFVEAVVEVNLHSVRRFSLPAALWAVQDFFHDPMARPMRVIHGYLEPFARKALDRKRQRQEKGQMFDEDEVETYAEHLAASTDDVILIRDQLLTMLMAARDTTSTLLTCVCYLLARHPDVMARLRDEIVQCYGTSSLPTYEDMKHLKLLRAVLNETLRLFPPITGNLREMKAEGIIPTSEGPIYVPRQGLKVMYSTNCLHMSKDLWGDDAEDFDPQRWLDGRTAGVLGGDSGRFLPFHAGPRICLGMDLAYNQASFVLIRLLQVFDTFTIAQNECAPLDSLPPKEWKSREGRQATEEFWPGQQITMYAKGGMWLRMHVAQ